MTPWTDREIMRFQFRAGLFERRGIAAERAEILADMLALRDQQQDDRRLCLECSGLQRDGGCMAARQGLIRSASTRHQPVLDVLHRCERFEWSKPA